MKRGALLVLKNRNSIKVKIFKVGKVEKIKNKK
jgi:hypothetical protein